MSTATIDIRTRILEAAAAVFTARGLGETTVQHLLQEANVSRRTFYRYFRNQEAVLAGLYDLACDVLLQAIQAIIDVDTRAIPR